eukprot:jgi/Hompol1/113/HPOL_002443-RA
MGLPHKTKEEDLGLEATNRFLKAKLHVLQQELDKIVAERNNQTLVEKLKVTIDEQKHKLEESEIELQQTKKQLDDTQRQSKQFDGDINSRDLRLNRALEEIEKLKTILSKKDGDSKDKLDVAKRAADGLFAENKKLQRQKAELLAAFKKQAQLITVLKRQK